MYKLGTKCSCGFLSTEGRYPCWAVLYFSKKEPMGKGMNPFFKARMCRYMHVCIYAYMHACVYACVCERESEREYFIHILESINLCMYVCMYMYLRERESEGE